MTSSRVSRELSLPIVPYGLSLPSSKAVAAEAGNAAKVAGNAEVKAEAGNAARAVSVQADMPIEMAEADHAIVTGVQAAQAAAIVRVTSSEEAGATERNVINDNINT